MSKYYTPELDEFKLGFIYEEKHNDQWITQIVESIDCLDWIFDICTHRQKDCLSNFIRVKLLDSSNIEALGFIPSYSGVTKEFKAGSICIELKEELRYVNIYKDDKLKFTGKLKNINQLKDVLEFIK